jgi:hypothetical protein
VDPGSIAFGSWNNNEHAGDPNNPGVSFSPTGRAGHRFFLTGTLGRNFLPFGRSAISAFFEARPAGNPVSYTYSGDLNGDGGTSNDLLYVPRNTSEMNFVAYTQSGRTFSAAEQAAAWEAYIAQDPYLSKRRGQFAERGGVMLPMVRRLDVSLSQDLAKNLWNRRHSLQLRVDMLNVGNMFNSDWGVGQRLVSNQPLLVTAGAQADAQRRERRAAVDVHVVPADDVPRRRLSLSDHAAVSVLGRPGRLQAAGCRSNGHTAGRSFRAPGRWCFWGSLRGRRTRARTPSMSSARKYRMAPSGVGT